MCKYAEIKLALFINKICLFSYSRTKNIIKATNKMIILKYY